MTARGRSADAYPRISSYEGPRRQAWAYLMAAASVFARDGEGARRWSDAVRALAAELNSQKGPADDFVQRLELLKVELEPVRELAAEWGAVRLKDKATDATYCLDAARWWMS